MNLKVILSGVALACLASPVFSAVLVVEGDDLERNRRENSAVEQFAGNGSSLGVKPEQIALTDMRGEVNRVFISEAFDPVVVSGMARDIGLSDSIDMILPDDWTVSYRISRESQRYQVSWRGGVQWTNILRDLMAQSKGYAFVDPLHKKLVISAAPTNEYWDVYTTDKTLRIALNRWSSISGWQLVWDLDRDFNIEAAATVTGDFKTAVAEVVHSLSQSDYPVRAIFYDKSKTLRIVKYTAGYRNQK